MLAILKRLWELENGERIDASAVREFLALWKTLNTTLEASTSSLSDIMQVGDKAFVTLLACVRGVLSDITPWILISDVHDDRSVLELVIHVLVRVASQGERERDALIRDGVADLVVHSITSQRQQDIAAAAEALHVLQTLALDAENRHALDAAGVIPLTISLISTHVGNASIQLFGCKLLQLLAYDDKCRDKIAQHKSLDAVLQALRQRPNDSQLAESALDFIYFVSVSFPATSAATTTQLQAQIEGVLDAVFICLPLYAGVVPIQSHGMGILSALAAHALARKRLLQRIAIWELMAGAVMANREVASESFDFLKSLLADPSAYEALYQTIRGCVKTCDCAIPRAFAALTALRNHMESMRSDDLLKSIDIEFVLERLQCLLEATQKSHERSCDSPVSPESHSLRPLTTTQLLTDEDDEVPVAGKHTHYASPRAFDPCAKNDDSNRTITDNDDDFQQFLSGMALQHDDEYFQRFIRGSDQPDPVKCESVPSSQGAHEQDFVFKQSPTPEHAHLSLRSIETSNRSESSANWKTMYEASVKEANELKAKKHLLQENHKIVLRRTHEQSRLLSIYSSRLQHHMEVHQQALDRMRTLEKALDEAHRKFEAERELRLAEVAQSEKLSATLHDARKEIKTLSAQNSSTSRELMERERLRIDYQQRASDIKQMKQKIEMERDVAVFQAQAVTSEKSELSIQLENCRREGAEALLMREEDIDAPRPRIFNEVIRHGGSPPKPMTRQSSHIQTRTRASDLWRNPTSQGTVIHARDSSTPRSMSLWGQCGIVPASESQASGDQEQIDRDEIERTLKAAYTSMEFSLDGNGVHVASIRRFFLESGLVQPPIVAGDVDVILAKVLNQMQEQRKKSMPRKDFAFAQTTAPTASRSDTTRFRYFDQVAFYEAVTLVGMKCFPRYDTLRVLQTVVGDYLHPMQRRERDASVNSTISLSSTKSLRRSSSVSSISGVTPISPTYEYISVMKAMLNGLAIRIGHGNDSDPLGSEDEGGSRSRSIQSSLSSRKNKREEVIYSILEMLSILAREQKPLLTICEFYCGIYHHSASKDELFALSFELVLNFALDFEIIPAFMDRVSLKHLYAEVSGYIKAYFSTQKKFPHATDKETLKNVAFLMMLARIGIELFSTKVDYETPEKQITGLIQWIDNSAGREKLLRKTALPMVIRFSRKLYAIKM